MAFPLLRCAHETMAGMDEIRRYRWRIVILCTIVVLLMLWFFYNLDSSAGNPGDPVSMLG